MNKQMVQQINEDMEKAMAQIEKKYGVTFSTKSRSYNDAEFNFKGTFLKDDKKDEVFANKAMMLGLNPNLLGQEIVIRGERFTIIDINTAGRRYPIIVENQAGEQHKCAAGDSLMRMLIEAQ